MTLSVNVEMKAETLLHGGNTKSYIIHLKIYFKEIVLTGSYLLLGGVYSLLIFLES